MSSIRDNKKILDDWNVEEARLLPFNYLLGKIIEQIEVLSDAAIDAEDHPECDRRVYTVRRGEGDRHAIVLHLSDGQTLLFWHEHECCEMVEIQDIVGDLNDLIGCPILLAEDAYFPGKPSDSAKTRDEEGDVDWYQAQPHSHFTWTFYKLATIKGYVDIRWYGGSSSGAYAETADLVNITPLTSEEINKIG